MFFCPDLLKKRRSLFLVWMASTHRGNALTKHLNARSARAINLPEVVEQILNTVLIRYPESIPRSPIGMANFSLYLSSKLMFGCCVLLRKQTDIILTDLKQVLKAINDPKFRKDGLECIRFVAGMKRNDEKPDPKGGQQLISEDNCFDLSLELHHQLGLDDPLVYPHSVSETAVTMQEDWHLVTTPDEDFSFGDEGNVYSLEELIGSIRLDQRDPLQPFGNLGDTTPTADHSLRKKPTDTHPEIVADATQDVVSSEPPSNILPTSRAENLTHQPLASPETEQSITARIMQDDQIFQSFLPETENLLPVQDEPTETCRNVSDGIFTLPCADVENSQIPNGPLEIVIPRDVDHEASQEISDTIQLSDVPPPETHKRQRKRPSHLIIDDEVQIPYKVMKAGNANKGAYTLRKESIFNEAMARFIRSKWLNLSSMNQPGRGGSINEGLRELFSRNLVTCPAPTDKGVLKFPFHEVERAKVQEEPARVEDSVARVDDGLPLDKSSLTTNTEFLSLDLGRSHVRESEAMAESLPLKSRAASVDLLAVTPPTSKRARLDSTQEVPAVPIVSEPPLEVSLNAAEQVYFPEYAMEQSATEQPATEQPATEQPAMEQLATEQAAHAQQEIPGSRAEGGLEIVPSTSEAAELGMSGEHAIAVPIASEPPVVMEMSPGLGVTPLIQTTDQNIFGESPRRSLSSPETRTPVSTDTVLLRFNELADENNTNTVPIDDLCPPARTRKFKAANMFSALLDLHQKNFVKLHQDMDGDSAGPIHVTGMKDLGIILNQTSEI